MTQISRFIWEIVPVAQRVTGDGGESAATVRGGGFAEYALVSLHCLRIQKPKVTKLVDTASQAVLDVHCSTNREGSDADLAEQIARRNAGDLRSLAAHKGYDKQSLREGLRDLGIRPLIKHRIFVSYDHAHNARIDDNRYNQRSVTETVNSAVKRSLGFAVRARSWFREFREIALMCVVYNIKRFVKQ
jgi:IS5 family transposase